MSVLFAAAAIVFFSGTALAVAQGGAAESAANLEEESFYDAWLKDRLSVGLSLSYSKLTDATRPKDRDGGKTFVGYVWKLEDTDEVHVLPTVSYWAAPYLRLSLFWNSVAGHTRNYNLQLHSDGDVTAEGPALLVEGLYPICGDTVFLHAGVGLTYAFCDFDEDTWWHLGYGSYDSWVNSFNKRNHVRSDHFREIEVDDAVGYLVSAGVSWRPIARAEIDLSVRHVWLDPDCDFGYRYTSRRETLLTGDFELNHLSVVLTGSYVF